VYVYAITLPFIETLIGIFVLIGLESRYAIVFGILLIASLTLRSTLRQHWQLLAARERNLYSFGYVFGRKS
jgi:uncharacterized membrane protein YphA (DoxX/SURF4 family)